MTVRSVILAGALGAVFVSAATGADPILPLNHVQPGMIGEARTVVSGTEIARFPVTVIAVDQDRNLQTLGTLGPAILMRASGPLMDQTGGIAAGMSGSPVYVTGADGVERVIGAISFGTGDEANLIGGITPIEHMLAVGKTVSAQAARRPAARRPSRVVSDRGAARAVERRNTAARAFYPLQNWTVAGVSRSIHRPLSRSIGTNSSRRLVPVLRGPAALPQAPFVPGSTLSAQLVGGDITVAAVGTTTYVADDGRIYGFGHPFFGTGASRLMLGGGWVHQIVPAPIANQSYKLADPGGVRGEITVDGTAGVVGRPGPAESIEVVATSFDKGSGRRSEIRSTMSPDARFAPVFSDLIQRESAFRVRDGAFTPGTLSITVRLESPKLKRPIIYRNRYASVADAIFDADPAVSRQVAILLRNSLREIPISKITINQTLQDRILAARILDATVVPRKVRRGQKAKLRLRVQPWRRKARTITVPFRVPRNARLGRRGVAVEPKTGGGFNRSLGDLDLALSYGLSSRGAAADTTLRRFERVVNKRRRGTRIDRIRAAIPKALPKRHNAVRVSFGSAVGPGRDVTVPYVIYDGSARSRVRVLKAAR